MAHDFYEAYGETDDKRSGRPTIAPDQVRIGWKDYSVSLVGIHTIVVAILVGSLVWLGYLLNESVTGTQKIIQEAMEKHSREQADQHAAIADDIRRNLGRVSQGQEKIADAMEAQTYLMTKTEKERQLYKLDMPESLRKRIR